MWSSRPMPLAHSRAKPSVWGVAMLRYLLKVLCCWGALSAVPYLLSGHVMPEARCLGRPLICRRGAVHALPTRCGVCFRGAFAAPYFRLGCVVCRSLPPFGAPLLLPIRLWGASSAAPYLQGASSAAPYLRLGRFVCCSISAFGRFVCCSLPFQAVPCRRGALDTAPARWFVARRGAFAAPCPAPARRSAVPLSVGGARWTLPLTDAPQSGGALWLPCPLAGRIGRCP